MRVGGKRVARLMHAAHLQGVSRRKRYGIPRRQADAFPAPDLVERDFSAKGPDAEFCFGSTELTAFRTRN